MKADPIFFALIIILLLSSIIQISCSTLELESQCRDRDIYVSMIAENPMTRAQVMMQGLVVWLDPKGKKEKTFGIKFPISRQGEEMLTRETLDEFDREEMMEKFQESLTELKIWAKVQLASLE